LPGSPLTTKISLLSPNAGLHDSPILWLRRWFRMAQHTSWARQTSAHQQGLLHTECPRTQLHVFCSLPGGQRGFHWRCALAASDVTSRPRNRETPPPLQGRVTASCLNETTVFTGGRRRVQGVRPRTALNKCHTYCNSQDADCPLRTAHVLPCF
jgi:hypothetical protein